MTSTEPASAQCIANLRVDQARGHPVRGRAGPGGQRRDLDRRGLVSPPGNRGPGNSARLCSPGRVCDDHPMEEGRDYIVLDQTNLKRTRNTRGILIGTSRTNPGKDVTEPAHLSDPKRTAQLRTVHRALSSLGVDALVSIGGDDTLKSANKFKRIQEYFPQASGASRSSTFPRRSTTTTAESISRSATSRRSRPWRARSATCWPTPRPAGCSSWSKPWAEAPAGWPTARPSPARRAWSSRVEDLVGESRDHRNSHRSQDQGMSSTRRIMNVECRRRYDRRRDDRPRSRTARSSA